MQIGYETRFIFVQMNFYRHFLLVFCLVLTYQGFSQKTFKGYATTGLQLTQIDYDNLAGYKKPGVYAGLGVYLDLSDRWRSSLEIGYAQSGSWASAKEIQFNNSQFDKINLDYVVVPLSMTYMDWLSDDELYYRMEFTGGLSYWRLINSKVLQIDGADITETFPYANNVLSSHLGFYYCWSLKWAAGFVHKYTLTSLRPNNTSSRQIGKELSFRVRRIF